MQICPTTAAFNYADNEDGSPGFFLVLTLRSGVSYRGSCTSPKGGVIWMNRDNDQQRPVCIRLDEVASAEVEW